MSTNVHAEDLARPRLDVVPAVGKLDAPRFPPARWLNTLYCGLVMPRTATLISRDRSGAYRYLPKSVGKFMSREAMCELLARTGAEAHASGDFALEQFLHLYALNRGILLTPFHNMALMSPATTAADVDRHTEVFDEALAALTRG